MRSPLELPMFYPVLQFDVFGGIKMGFLKVSFLLMSMKCYWTICRNATYLLVPMPFSQGLF